MTDCSLYAGNFNLDFRLYDLQQHLLSEIARSDIQSNIFKSSNLLFSNNSIPHLPWNHTAHSPERSGRVAFSSRDQVKVQMRNALPGYLTIVKTDVKSLYFRIFFLQGSLNKTDQVVAGYQFMLAEFNII